MAVNLATAYVEIIPSAKGIGSSITKELGGVVPQANSAGQKIGSKLSDGIKSTLKRGALGAGAAAGAAIGVTLKKGFDRLSSIDQAQAKLKGLGNSAEDVSKIMGNAMAAVKGTAYGFGDAAGLAAQMVASGIKPGRELEQVLKTVGDTAAISGRELNDIGLIFGSVAARGKLQGDDMLQLMSSGIPVLQLLGDELGKTSAEVSDMVTAGEIDFATFERAMRKGMGGAALEAGKTFKGAVDNTNAALGRLGAAILDAPFKVAPGVFSKITDGIDRLTGKVQALTKYLQTGVDTEGYMFKAFGSREQADQVIANLDKVRENYKDFIDGLKGNNDAPGMFGSLGESVRKIKDAFSDLAPSVGQIVSSLVQSGMAASVVSLTGAFATLAPLLANVLAPVLASLAKLMTENQGAVNILVTALAGMFAFNKVIGPIGAAGKALKGFGGTAKTVAGLMKLPGGASLVLKQALSGLGGVFSKLFPNISKFMGVLKNVGVLSKFSGGVKTVVQVLSSGLVKGLRLAAGGFKALGLAIAANPIGAIVTAIAAVVAGLIYFFTQTETGKRLWASFMEFMGQVWESIKVWAQSAWDWIVQVWNGIPEWFSQKWQAVKDAVSAVWEAIKGAIMGAWTAITEWFTTAWDAYKAQVQANWEMVKSIFSMAWEGIKLVVVTVWNGIVAFFTAAWQGFVLLAQTVWNGLVTVFTFVWSTIQTVVTVVWNAIQTFLTTAWNLLVALATTVWNGIVSIISTVWNTISSIVQSVWNAIYSFISGAWSAFTGFVSSTWENIKSIISNAWEAVKSSTQAAWEAVKAKVSEAVQALISKVQEFVSNLRSKMEEAANKVREFPGKVKSAFSNAGSWLVQAGKDIIRGLINGIKSMAGFVGGAIMSILPGAVQGWISLGDGGISYSDGGLKQFARGGITSFARGGRKENHVAQIANAGDWRLWAEPETGGEAYIPLARSKRGRSTAILSSVADIFGLQLVDNDGNRVQATTPGGTGPKPGAVAKFAEGGIRTAQQVRRFVEGEAVAGVQAERSLQGAPYENYPGRNGAWGDCSYTQGIISAFMLGIQPWPRKFSTVSQLNWLRSNGANIGMGPAGAYRVGWYDNGGGQFGHTSGTLPDGTNVEMGGGNGGGAIGRGAVPWNHPQFTHHAWIPAANGAAASTESEAIGDSTANIPISTPSATAATGTNPNMVPVSDSVAAKTDAAGITDSSASESSTWSDTVGTWAKSVVSGHVADILKVFGIPDQIPPILAAGKKIYVQATKSDPDGKKAEADLEKAADAKLEAEGSLTAGQVKTDKTPIDDAQVSQDQKQLETIEKVAPGTVSKGEYKLGESFYAEEVARAAASLGMGFGAAKIAWATVLTEAGDPPKMWASSVDTASQQYPHEAVGSDHDSSGLFQQRSNGAWGDVSQRMNARASAMMFLNALAKVSGWESMDAGAAAQAVQRSAFPNRYAGNMSKAESVMSRFKGKLPGFRRGGMVYGGSGKNLDDVLAWLSNGEMVINSDSVSADPEMAKILNEEGPQAVKNSVLGDAVGTALKSAPEFRLSGSLRDMLAQNLHGAADMASNLAAAGVSAGFDAAGGSAKALLSAGAAPLNSAIPGVGSFVSSLPADGTVGVAGDVVSWYTGKVTSGIGHAVADAALGVYDIGASQVDELLNVLGAGRYDPAQLVDNSGLGELHTVLQDSVEKRFGDGQQAEVAGGDTFQFYAQDFGQMESMYRKERAKRGKVGARG